MKSEIRNPKSEMLTRLALWLVAGILTLGAWGCAHAPKHPEAIAFFTLSDIHNAVDKAMNVYGGLVRAEKVSDVEQAKIDDAYAKYQAAMRVAIKAARRDWTAIAPDDVVDLADELEELIYAL